MSKNRFYVVWEGKEPGIYNSWRDCERQIKGFEGAIFKGFVTEAEARMAMLSPYKDYIGKNAKPKEIDPALIEKHGVPDLESMAVDAACSGNPGKMEYRGVYARTGEEVFRQGPFPEGTNNIGEFLALVHGLALLKQQGSPLPIYTDSETALSWIRAKKARTKLERNAKNEELFGLLARAEKWLQTNEYTTKILKWETAVWGEIPADFGRK